jgi:hypothetical protein
LFSADSKPAVEGRALNLPGPSTDSRFIKTTPLCHEEDVVKIKAFQKNLNSGKQFNEVLEREISDWLASNPNISITDAQIASSVIVRPGRKEVYVQPLCILSYVHTENDSSNLCFRVKLIPDTVIHNTPLERGSKLESSINDWITANPDITLRFVRVTSDAASWSDGNGSYHYCHHSLCLLLGQVTTV